MALSSDPEKRARQLANLAKSNAKLAERLERGDVPGGPGPASPAARGRRQVVRDQPAPRPARRAQRRQQPAPPRNDDRDREDRDRDDSGKRRGGGFFTGLFDW